MIYEHGEPWWNDVDRRKLLIRPPEFSLTALPTVIYQQIRRILAKEMMDFVDDISITLVEFFNKP
jgi:hypothetical protein